MLSLTVSVKENNSTVCFGNGFESIVIDARSCGVTKASLLNETMDLLFQVTGSADDLPLGAFCRNPILGYGTRVFELQNSQRDIVEVIADTTVPSCISLVQKEPKRH